eukprot:TRINITY_DN68253_c0_g1_i1.p1 TRINITY_DN68253_c0_g1~~TRINITY_DN68253_c0_g1_i1.p1  ORF type:complete len:839 (-),score=106.52 TRINITY_DN68253_c0_g1_i1:56-2572(-)
MPRAFAVVLGRCVDAVLPWLLSMFVGILTAASGTFIAKTSDFLTDIRFGHCNGHMLSSRSECCGGVRNVDIATGRCKEPPEPIAANLAPRSADLLEWSLWFGGDCFASFGINLLVTVLLSGATAYLVNTYEPRAKGSGIPCVKASASGFAVARSFSVACLFVKTIGLAMVVGAGLSLGKEGPLIHIGGCWAHLLRSGGPFSAWTNAIPSYEMVCVGSAAGVATAFGAPIGGVLFAVEELGSVRVLSQRALLLAFAGSFTASFTLKSFNPDASSSTLFDLPLKTLNLSNRWLHSDLIMFLLLGVVGGLVGASFVRLNMFFARRRKKLASAGRIWLLPEFIHDAMPSLLPKAMFEAQWPGERAKLKPSSLHVIELSLIAIGTCSLNYPFTRLLRNPMLQVIRGLFLNCPQSLGTNLGLCLVDAPHGFATDTTLQAMLLFAAVTRFLQTAVTFGSMIPSGLFIPSLYIGAVIGRVVGLWCLPDGEQKVHPNAFAMIGAVAVLSGFARMTVSLVVIMLELTGDLDCALPFMCAVLGAKIVGDTFTVSIYDGHASLLGYARIEDPKDIRLAAQMSDVVVPCGKPINVLDVSGPVSASRLLQALRALNQATWFAVANAGDMTEDSAASRSSSAGLPDVLTVASYLQAGTSASLTKEPSTSRFPEGRSSASREEEDDEAPSHRQRVPWLPELILLRRQKLTSEAEVCGVIADRSYFQAWLQRAYLARGIGYRGGATAKKQLMCVFHNGAFAAIRDGCITLDARPLVTTGVRRLQASAPLLTAFCSFREFPSLQYCICSDDLHGRGLSLLSREGFECALGEARFAAAFRDSIQSPLKSPDTDVVDG